MLLINGDAFEGQFKNDKIDGFCKFIGKNGETYEGQWSRGVKNGKGVYTWPNGKSQKDNIKMITDTALEQ